MRKLLHPDDALAWWQRRWARQHRAWWAATDAPRAVGATAASACSAGPDDADDAGPVVSQGAEPGVSSSAGPGADARPVPADAVEPWPQRLPLGQPTEADAASDPAGVRAWAQAWAGWRGAGQVQWAVRRWARLGEQRLPEALLLAGPDEVARLLGHEAAWGRAVRRRSELSASLSAVRTVSRPLPATPRVYEALAGWPDDEHARLQALLAWLAAHPASGLLLRQLPVEGVHTKWIEQRRALVLDLVAWLHGDAVPADAARDLPALLGLARPPARLRIRILCPRLRAQVGGLDDLEAPLAQVAALPIAPQAVLAVENLDTGLALPAWPGVAVVMKLGLATPLLAGLPWLRGVPVHYWGDLDTHGLAALALARRAVPGLRSCLMDVDTLERHRHLAVDEPQPWAGEPPQPLEPDERALYDSLVSGRWGARVRLEQERLPWPWVLQALQRVLPSGPAGG